MNPEDIINLALVELSKKYPQHIFRTEREFKDFNVRFPIIVDDNRIDCSIPYDLVQFLALDFGTDEAVKEIAAAIEYEFNKHQVRSETVS